MTPKPDFVADVLTMNNVASIEKNGLTLIRGGGRKFLCEKILTVDSFGYCEYTARSRFRARWATAAKSC